MARQQQQVVAVLALLLCVASAIVESNGFTFPVYSAERAFRRLSRHAAAPQPVAGAGPSMSPAQPPSGSAHAPAALAPAVAPAPGPMNPALAPVTPAHAPAPTPSRRTPAPSPAVPALNPPTPTPAPAPMAGLPVAPSPNTPAPAPVLSLPPSPAPVLSLPPSPAPVLPLTPGPAPAPATTLPSGQVSAPPTNTLASGAAGFAASTGVVLLSAVAAIALSRPAAAATEEPNARDSTRSCNGSGYDDDGHGETRVLVPAAGPRARSSSSSATSRRRARRRRRVGASPGTVRGLLGRAAESGGVSELRRGGEHGGDARPDLLLGAQGCGAQGGGLPLPGLPERPEPRHLAQHDQGTAAARRLQGQDAALQQVPRFRSWCAHRVSCSCSIFRGAVLRPVTVAVIVNPFRITGSGSNREPDHHSSTLPSAFWRCRPLSTTADLPRCSNCCCDSVRVPALVRAGLTCHVPSSCAPPLPPQSDHR